LYFDCIQGAGTLTLRMNHAVL